MSYLRVEKLTKRFGASPALRDVTFDIGRDELVTVVGPSGCGKTTLLRLIAGLIRPDGGSIRLDGRDLAGVPPARRDVAMVFQDYALYPHLSVLDNIAFPLRMRGERRNQARQQAAETARALSIHGLLSQRPGNLSGGEQQRVALARAIVRKPKLFLMDEPLSNLDAALRTQLRDLVIELQARLGTALIHVTHDQTEALTMGRRVAVLLDGRLRQLGSPREIYQRPNSLGVARLIGHPPMNLLQGAIETANGRKGLAGRGYFLPLPDGVMIPEQGGGGVMLGLRPEDLSTTALEAGGARAQVRWIEEHGHEVICHAGLGEETIRMRLSRAPGAPEIFLHATSLEPCWFDPATGVRIDG